MRRLAKQPLDAKAEGRKNDDEQQDGPPSWNFRLEEADGPLELVGQIGECYGKGGDVRSGRADTVIEVLRDRLFVRLRFLGGFARVLLFQQPLLDLRIGKQRHEFGDLRRRRRLSARR